MDGRTDIKWYTSIRFRLSEKAQRLSRFSDDLAGIDTSHELVATLRKGAQHAARSAKDFADDLSTPVDLSAAANRLTADHPDKLTSLTPIIAQLEKEASEAEIERAVALKTITAAMRADGLGMGHIHFRVNAKQLHNAIRGRLDETPTLDLASKGAMATLRRMLEEVQPLRSNFASLAIESSTAIRQFLAMAQILEHVDADTPIRMLIAECEQPSTILAALYFAKLFGIEDKVDVSPLFETESALELVVASWMLCAKRSNIKPMCACVGALAFKLVSRTQGALSVKFQPALPLSGFMAAWRRRSTRMASPTLPH